MSDNKVNINILKDQVNGVICDIKTDIKELKQQVREIFDYTEDEDVGELFTYICSIRNKIKQIEKIIDSA